MGNRHKDQAKSTEISSQPNIIDTLFSFSMTTSRNIVKITDSLKVKFIITKNPDFIYHNKITYKLYYVTDQNQKYLLEIGKKLVKKSLTLSHKLQFSKNIPPCPLFHFEIQLFQDSTPIKHFHSEDFIGSVEGAEDQINFHDVEYFSSVLIPMNPFAFWLHLSSNPTPDSIPLELQFKLMDKNLVLEEKSFKFRVGGPGSDPNKINKYPFQVEIPRLENKDKRLRVQITVIEPELKKELYKSKESLPMEISLTGLRIDHVGYKRDLKLGEIAYMVGDLVNKTPYAIKGKANFFFYSHNLTDLVCFNRKFRILDNNYEKISEDIPLLEFMGGEEYWVICHMNIKAKGINYKLEAISTPRLAPIPDQKPFFASLRAKMPKDGLRIKQIIPIGIDTRIRALNEFQPIFCEVHENYENISHRTLYRFKLRSLDSDHSKFHWKIPPRYGHYTLTLHYFYNSSPVNGENVEKNELAFDIFP
ncbi:MAG: hypothetical protein ACTSRK_15460 [Promethearchaeota archaeon]